MKIKEVLVVFGIALAAAFARADVSGETEWQDVPPETTLGAVVAGVGLATTNDCARAVAQEAELRADADATNAAAIAALTSAAITNADPARVFGGKPGTMSERVIVSDGTTSLVIDENFITRHTQTNGFPVNNFYWLPNASGTLALQSDIPEVPTAVSAFENDAGYLTAESDPATGLTNDTAYVRGKKVVSEETDPSFAAWKNGTKIAAGSGSNAGLCGVAIGCSAKSANGTKGNYGTAVGYGAMSYANYGVAIGSGAFVKSAGVCGIAIGSGTVTNDSATTIGDKAKSFGDYSFNINTPDPSRFYFAATNAATARTLQSYLDERATTNALAAVSNAIPVISATDATFSNAVNVAARALVKSKLESLDKAKSSIGETIAALQSIYETETK